MKVKFMVSLMFLLYGPEQQADLAGGSVLLGAEQLFSLCFYLRIPASLPAAPEAHEAALRNALNTSRPPWSGTDTCLISHCPNPLPGFTPWEIAEFVEA